MATGFLVKRFLLLSLSLIFLLPSCLALSVSVSAVDNGQFFPGGRLLFNIQREADDETIVDILLSNGSNGNRTLIFGSVDLTQPSQSNAGFTIPDVSAGRAYTLRLVRSSNKQFLVDSSPFEIVATPSTSSSSSATSTPSSNPSSNTPSDKTKKELPLGAIIGGVLGGLGGILLGAIIAVLCWRKRGRQQGLDSPTSVETDNEKGHKTTLNIPFVNPLKRAQSKSSSVDHTVLPYHVPPPPLRPSTPPPNPLAPLRVDTTGNPPATSSTTTFAPSSVSTSNIKSKILRERERERDFLSGTPSSSSIPSPSSGPSSTTRASSSIVAHASPVDSTPGSSFAVAGSPGGRTEPSTAAPALSPGPTSTDNTAQRAEYLRMERDRINQEIARLEGRSTFSGSVLTTSTNPSSSIGYTTASGSHSGGGSVDESAETRTQLAALREQVRRLEMRQTVSTFDDFSEPPPEYYRDSQPPPPLPLPNSAAGMSQPISPPVDSKSGV